MQLVTSEQLEQMKANGDKILVDFYASWCGPCKMLIPKLELLATKYPNVTFVKIDVDQNREYAMSIELRSVPTVKIFDGQTLINSSTGVQPDSHYTGYLSNL